MASTRDPSRFRRRITVRIASLSRTPARMLVSPAAMTLDELLPRRRYASECPG
jgi:hypothetical protein